MKHSFSLNCSTSRCGNTNYRKIFLQLRKEKNQGWFTLKNVISTTTTCSPHLVLIWQENTYFATFAELDVQLPHNCSWNVVLVSFVMYFSVKTLTTLTEYLVSPNYIKLTRKCSILLQLMINNHTSVHEMELWSYLNTIITL